MTLSLEFPDLESRILGFFGQSFGPTTFPVPFPPGTVASGAWKLKLRPADSGWSSDFASLEIKLSQCV